MEVQIHTRRDGVEELYKLEVSFFATVKDIKEQTKKAIRERKGEEVPVGLMKLFFRDKELKDGETVGDCSLVEGSRIRLVYYDAWDV